MLGTASLLMFPALLFALTGFGLTYGNFYRGVFRRARR